MRVLFFRQMNYLDFAHDKNFHYHYFILHKKCPLLHSEPMDEKLIF